MSPPDDAAYLANACVAESARREGIRASARKVGGRKIWCSRWAGATCGCVRENEPAPLALYMGEGYERVSKEKSNVFEGMFGDKRASRIMMRKELRSDGSCNFML